MKERKIAYSSAAIVRAGHVSVVRELMGFNADPFLPTPQGILPIELAEQKGHAEVIMALDSALRELESRHPNSDSEDEMERGEGDSTALSASSQSQLRQSAVSLPSPVLEDHIKKNLLSLSEEEPQASYLPQLCPINFFGFFIFFLPGKWGLKFLVCDALKVVEPNPLRR